MTMKRHEVGRAIHKNLKAAGYEDEKGWGSATRTMMHAAQHAVEKHHMEKKKDADKGEGEYMSEREKAMDPKERENRAVAGKMQSAISGISAHHTDPHDVGASEIIRSTVKGHSGRNW